jgi:hypothetical protein
MGLLLGWLKFVFVSLAVWNHPRNLFWIVPALVLFCFWTGREARKARARIATKKDLSEPPPATERVFLESNFAAFAQSRSRKRDRQKVKESTGAQGLLTHASMRQCSHLKKPSNTRGPLQSGELLICFREHFNGI